ncbi:hypothetical protein SAMN05216284_102281 [Micromonospora sediminimaris]|nr:hypothetical protein SAMN05216284_102281 [Micromonospora sediminimaris]
MNLDSLPNTVPTSSAYDTTSGWFCHWSVSVSPEVADRPVTEPDRPDSARAEVSSRPSSGRSALPAWTGPPTPPHGRIGTARPSVRSWGSGAVVVRSGEVVRHDCIR